MTFIYNLHPPSQISGDEFYSDVAKGILQYVTRSLSHRVCVHRGRHTWVQEGLRSPLPF